MGLYYLLFLVKSGSNPGIRLGCGSCHDVNVDLSGCTGVAGAVVIPPFAAGRPRVAGAAGVVSRILAHGLSPNRFMLQSAAAASAVAVRTRKFHRHSGQTSTVCTVHGPRSATRWSSSEAPHAVPERCPRFSPKTQDTSRRSPLRQSGHVAPAGSPWNLAAATSLGSASRSFAAGTSPFRQRASSALRSSVWSTSSRHVITRPQ